MRTRMRRGLAVLVITLSAVVATGAPASATVVNGTLWGSDLTFSKSGLTTQWVNLWGFCAAPQIQFDITATTFRFTAFSATEMTTWYGFDYVAQITRYPFALPPGTVAGTDVLNARMAVEVSIYSADGVCGKGALRCSYLTILQYSGDYIGYGGGSPAAPAASDYINLTGSNVSLLTSRPGCGTPFNYYLGGTLNSVLYIWI